MGLLPIPCTVHLDVLAMRLVTPECRVARWTAKSLAVREGSALRSRSRASEPSGKGVATGVPDDVALSGSRARHGSPIWWWRTGRNMRMVEVA